MEARTASRVFETKQGNSEGGSVECNGHRNPCSTGYKEECSGEEKEKEKGGRLLYPFFFCSKRLPDKDLKPSRISMKGDICLVWPVRPLGLASKDGCAYFFSNMENHRLAV